jgi:hypothetical protein
MKLLRRVDGPDIPFLLREQDAHATHDLVA